MPLRRAVQGNPKMLGRSHMRAPLSSHQQALNEAAIHDLVRETGRPIHCVREAYAEEFARLLAIARVPDYLVLFAMRRTRVRLAMSWKRR